MFAKLKHPRSDLNHHATRTTVVYAHYALLPSTVVYTGEKRESNGRIMCSVPYLEAEHALESM
jgi:hypothetical protein